MRRAFLGLLLSLLPGLAAAQALPTDRPLRLLAGFAAGGAGDLVARILAEAVGPIIGTNVVVENRTGANGFIAAEAVARAAPDGATMLECTMGMMAISPVLPGAPLPLDPRRDLLPVANIAFSSYALVVAANSPWQSPAELIAAAKARPGAMSFASSGVGSPQHLSFERFQRMAGISMVHVPYRGAALAIPDILAGRTQAFITNLGDVAGQLRGGTLRALAIADEVGHPAFPNIPRLSATLPGFDLAGWFGLCGPPGLPMPLADAWATAVATALRQENVRNRLLENGLAPAIQGPAEFSARINADLQLLGGIIREAGIRAE